MALLDPHGTLAAFRRADYPTAQALPLNPGTAGTHVGHVLAKLALDNPTQLAIAGRLA